MSRLSRMTRNPAAISALAGGVAALGQAPVSLWPLTLIALAVVFVQIASATRVAQGVWRGWAAGCAGFALSLMWIVEPFLVDIALHGWMAPFALILMSGGLALFWGAAGGLAVWAGRKPVGRIWLFALALLAFEDLRGVLFTGFPWAMTGHVWIGTPVDQIASLGGALLLSALTLSTSAALATMWLRMRAGRNARAAVVGGVTLAAVSVAWLWGADRLSNGVPELDGAGPAGHQIRLVQGNVPQHLKWHRDHVERFFIRHLELSQQPAAIAPELVIWPETAAPFFLDTPGDGLRMVGTAAAVPVVLGIQRREAGDAGARDYFNSLAHIAPDGTVLSHYDKHHLVPFGEYIPLIGGLAADNGLAAFAARILSGYTPGPGPELMDLGPAGYALPLICYEAIFPRNLRTEQRPDWILQATNDGWFGTVSGPYQHLAQTQLRAIEFGLPLIRVANTGVSAVITAQGRITAQLGLGEAGVLDAPLPAALPPTLYSRWGDLPWHILLVLGLSLWLVVGRSLAHSYVTSTGPKRLGD